MKKIIWARTVFGCPRPDYRQSCGRCTDLHGLNTERGAGVIFLCSIRGGVLHIVPAFKNQSHIRDTDGIHFGLHYKQ